MKGDKGTILKSETISIDGYGVSLDQAIADPAYRSEFGKSLTLSLIDWDERGLMIDAQLVPGIIANYNKNPYPNLSSAEIEYDNLRKALIEGRHFLESTGESIIIKIRE